MDLTILVIDDQFGREPSMQQMLESTLLDFPARLHYCTGQVEADGERRNDLGVAVAAVGDDNRWSLVLLDMHFDSGPIATDGLPQGTLGDDRFGIRLEQELLRCFPALPLVRFTSSHERELDVGGPPRPFLSKLQAKAADLRLTLLDHGRLTPEQRRLLLKIPDDTVVSSPELFKVYTEAMRLARTDDSVLILGESGSGKEHVARYLHAVSAHASQPFVAVNLGSIPPTLVETELFGAVRGAYTGATTRTGKFAQAAGGTLFLDELAAMPLDKQPVLLRVLEERRFTPVGSDRSVEVACNVIAASQDQLDGIAAAERLRSDLLARFHHTIRVPPLRDRPEDIDAILAHELQAAQQSQGKQGMVVDPMVARGLRGQPLLRNARDVLAVIRRAVALRPNNSVIRWEHLALEPTPTLPDEVRAPADASHATASLTDDHPGSWCERLPLRGALTAIDDLVFRMKVQTALRALRHCRHPVSGKIRVLPAMQLLMDDPRLTSMAAKRLLNQALGHASTRPLDSDELVRMIKMSVEPRGD
ncbi:sigma 54-interacting transcriptional regulator [Paucibacter sp. JuS9]|uniref:sigma 54-interacting transcriptional regulator n=1 Tax=Paucibacter sp. JuS9 TaxID=3228748 RepID=UPI0037582491